jgi:DNA-binding GntR family transcriptional regulator
MRNQPSFSRVGGVGPRSRSTGKIVARVRVITQTTGTANKAEQQRVGLSAAEPVLRLARVRYCGDRPFCYEKVVLALAWFPGLQGEDEITSSTTEIARKYGLTLGRALEQAKLARASKVVAAHLGIAEKAQVMKLDRVVAAQDGQAVEWRVAFVISD